MTTSPNGPTRGSNRSDLAFHLPRVCRWRLLFWVTGTPWIYFSAKGIPDATTRVHQPSRRRGGSVAAAGKDAAGADAADWHLVAIHRSRPGQPIPNCVTPPRPAGAGLDRRPQSAIRLP